MAINEKILILKFVKEFKTQSKLQWPKNYIQSLSPSLELEIANFIQTSSGPLDSFEIFNFQLGPDLDDFRRLYFGLGY